MVVLNSAVRVTVLVEKKGQLSFSNTRDCVMVTLLIHKVSNRAWQSLGVDMGVQHGMMQ